MFAGLHYMDTISFLRDTNPSFPRFVEEDTIEHLETWKRLTSEGKLLQYKLLRIGGCSRNDCSQT
jgi:hypothetical protein